VTLDPNRTPRKPRPPRKRLIVGPTSEFAANVAGVPDSQRTDVRTPAQKQAAHAVVPASAPKPSQHVVHNDPQVVSRQRALRAAGYPVAVDGIWGPQSQAAWSAYLNGIHHSGSAHTGPLSPGGAQAAAQVAAHERDARRRAYLAAQTVKVRQQAHAAAAQAAALAHTAAAEAKVHAQLSAIRSRVAKLHSLEPSNPALTQRLAAATSRLQSRRSLAPFQQRALDARAVADELHRAVGVAEQAFGKPAAAMTPDELVATTVDPLTGTLDPNKPETVKRVQEWLVAHGHKALPVNGEWNAATNDALLSTFSKMKRQERHAQVADVTKRFYDSGVIIPGQRLGSYAQAPKPAELVSILQQGGLQANALWREIMDRYNTSQPAFLSFQENQLDALASQLYPSWSSDSALSKLGVKASVQQRIAKLQLDAALAVERGEMHPEQAQAFVQQLGALGSATNSHDLKARLLKVKLDMDQHQAERMHAAMGDKHEVHGFWGHTLHTFGLLGVPAHKLTTGVELIVADAKYLADHPDRLLELQRSAEENKQIAASVQAFQEKNPWAQLGLEIAFDPLWLVDPVAIVGKTYEAAALTAYKLERVGLAMEQGGKVARISAPLLSRPAQTVRAFEEAGAGMAHFARGETAAGRLLQLDHARQVTLKLTRTKADALQAVQRRVRLQRRNQFNDLGRDLWGANPVDGELRFAIDRSTPIVGAALQRLVPSVVRRLADSDLSLFSHVTRDKLSVVGGQVRAYLTRAAQVTVHQNLAFNDARSMFVNTFFGRDVAASIKEQGMDPVSFWELVTKKRPARDAAEAALFRQTYRAVGVPEGVVSEQVALDAAQQEFKRVFAQLDVRGFGGHSIEMAERVKPLMDAAQDDIADTLALLQNKVEERVAARAVTAEAADAPAVRSSLFHPEGHPNAGQWVGAGREVTRSLLDEASAGFARTVWVANRAFGRGHTFDEMQTLRQLELESARNSAFGTISRKAGEDIASSHGAEFHAEKKYAELKDAWQRRADGLYYDTRETLAVPGHYASHLRDAVARTPEMSELLPQEMRDLLSMASGPAVQSPFAGELGDLADTIARIRLPEGFNRSLAGAAWHDFLLRGQSRGPDVSALGREFQDVFRHHTDLLDHAARIVTPRELVRDYALWAALAKAQSAPLRVAYKSLSAFLDVWLIATLPLRPGFVVRNVIDNTAKMLADGAVDPRAYFPRAAAKMSSVFHLGPEEMHDVLALGARQQHNPAASYLRRLIDSFWSHDEGVQQAVLGSHGVPVPRGVLEKMRFEGDAVDPAVIQSIRTVRNKLMRVMANMPENAAKRVLYRDTYYKAIRRGASEMEAFDEAIKRIDFVLFDYSKVSVLEDNLRFIFPFVQFWRKTATFWAKTAVGTPALPVELDRFESTLRDKQNADLPAWMRRYVNLEPIARVSSRIPGLNWVTSQFLDGMQTDPLNFFSFNVLYRTFKQENPDLPPDRAGLKFLAPFVDALNDWGLSMNPLVRKPAEFAGAFNYRAWQSIFPETGLFDAISRQFFTDSPQGFNLEAILEDKVLGMIGYDLGARQRIEQDFNQWVQLEMAAQAERGEPVDRDKATAKIQHYYVVQTVLGFFSGMYARRRDPADVYLYNLQQQLLTDQDAYMNLSEKEQRAYQLFRRRKEDPIAFNAYLETEPQVDAYYKMGGTHEQREAFKHAHPEIIPYVSGWKHANLGGDNFVTTLPLLADTDTAMAMLKLVQSIDADPAIKLAAQQMFVTPQLRRFWDDNDTPAQVRDKMLQGALHHHINSLQTAYFAIPESDHEARNAFLQANPLLPHTWAMNDSNSDDLKSVMNAMNATLRDRYFEFLDAKDYQAAREFLRRFPFIFEFTSAAGSVNSDGDWISYGGHKAKSQHARDYLAAKPYLDRFFSLLRADRAAARAYLDKSAQLRAYFARWGKGGNSLSQHAQDYLAVKTQLQFFFNLLHHDKARAQAWLDSDNPEAKKVSDYLRRYANSKGMTQHGLDYAAVKDAMTRYFKLKDESKEQARAFLKAHPELEAYFKKYGHFTKVARKWKDLDGSNDPALAARLDFWKRYWTLEPDQRPGFVAAHADDAGVFIYGSLSARQREDSQREYLRQAMAHKGMTKKMALYLHVKPLLDLYYTLSDPSEKDLFLRANPDVQNYLDSFGGGVSTGDKTLDGLIESYFKLDRHSPDRSAFIHVHPQLQDYFNRHSTPADRAMHELLDVYFRIPVGKARSRFSARHPEIQAYFDQRKTERDNELATAMSFDLVDPRVAPYLQRATAESGAEAIRMLQLLREGVARNKFKDGLSRRVDRAPSPSV
jgi:hypothetical protein